MLKTSSTTREGDNSSSNMGEDAKIKDNSSGHQIKKMARLSHTSHSNKKIGYQNSDARKAFTQLRQAFT